MTNRVIFRRSPLILIRTFVLVEACGLVLFFLLQGGGSTKYDLYTKLPIAALISYDTAKFLALSGMQFLITVYAFLGWYFERYFVESARITHERGVVFKKRKEVLMKESPTFQVISGSIGKMLHYGTVVVKSSYTTGNIALTDIPYPEKNIGVIAATVNERESQLKSPPDMVNLLLNREHEQLEFKSSMRFDRHIGKVNRELEKNVMKALAAFLNSYGGHVVLGADDAHTIVGLEQDYGTLQRHDNDGFENHFTQVFNVMIGPEFRRFVKLWFKQVDNKEV